MDNVKASMRQTVPSDNYPPRSTSPGYFSRSKRGCLIATAIVVPLALMFCCCGGLYLSEWLWGTREFRGGLRMTGGARRALIQARQERPDHLLVVTDTGTQFWVSFRPNRPGDEDKYVTFEEHGVKVAVEKCICGYPNWAYLRPIIAHNGKEDKTKGYKFGFLDVRQNDFPSVGR